MTNLDRMPLVVLDRPYRGGDGLGVFDVMATLWGLVLLVLAIAAVVALLWNSFALRAEMRQLRADLQDLRAVPPVPEPTAESTPEPSAEPSAEPEPTPKPKHAPSKEPPASTD